MKVNIEIGEKLAWVRSHLVVSVVVSCSSLLLLVPRVQSVLIFFWPLLLSTALFVTALLTIGDSHKIEEETLKIEEEALARVETEDVQCMGPAMHESADLHEQDREEIGESSGWMRHEDHHLERQRSLLDFVAEQHEGAKIHFDTLFQTETEAVGGGEAALSVDSSSTNNAEEHPQTRGAAESS